MQGKELVFGNVGLVEGTLHLYDTETRSWWSQLTGKAVDGPRGGQKLRKMSSMMTTWKRWKALHPETTAYIKRSVPYHQQSDFSGDYIAKMATKGNGPVESTDLVVGVEGHEKAKAYLIRDLAKRRVANDTLEGFPIVVYLSEDFATARIMDGTVNGQALTFSLAENDRMRDAETGSIWDPMTGKAISGRWMGKELKLFASTYSLWFAWNKYRPESELVRLE